MTIELDNIASGNSGMKINENFQRLEDYINDNLLHRDGVGIGQNNQMEFDLDMNGFALLNLASSSETEGTVLTLGQADRRYLLLSGGSLTGPVSVLAPTSSTNPVQKAQLDGERLARQDAISSIQSQLAGTDPLEASAFSEISWHDQVIRTSVTIPPNKNAWSFGPEITIADGQSVILSEGSYWTVAEGNGSGNGGSTNLSYDGGIL